MSQENVEIVRMGLDAWNRRDMEDPLADADPGIEFVNSPTAVEPGTRRGVSPKLPLDPPPEVCDSHEGGGT